MAGIIDGEGCIGLTPRGNNYALRVEVGITNEWLIQWLGFSFGGSVSFKPSKNKNWKPSWRWAVVANEALEFLRLIYPYLRLKKPQAEVAIKFQERRFKKKGYALPKDMRAWNEAQSILMHSLNKRGKTELT